MFGRWFRRRPKSLPSAALPDLDREASARWGRGPEPPGADDEASLDFGAVSGYHAGRTREGGRRRRRLLWSLLAGVVLGMVLVYALVRLAVFLSAKIHGTDTLGERLTFGAQGQEEIFYSGVSEEQVNRLADLLRREGLFGDERPKSVRVSRDGGVYAVGFAMEWNSWQDKNTVADFRDLLPRLSRGVFDGAPVEIHLCARQPDSQGRPMPTMRVIRAE